MGEYIHMEKKMSSFMWKRHEHFYEKTFSLKALAQRTPLLNSRPLFLPLFIHSVNTQHVLIE